MKLKINVPTNLKKTKISPQKVIKKVVVGFKSIIKEAVFFITFLLLLTIYLIRISLLSLTKIKIIKKTLSPWEKPANKIYFKITTMLGAYKKDQISSTDLIALSLRHLTVKKMRSALTVGGMAIGFGAVVFLLSLGYGVQNLVVSRVARLDEMKQADVSIGQASGLSFNSETLNEMKNIVDVDLILPMISVVSKVNFNNSVSDVVAYGVTSEFLKQSAIQPTRGEIFEDEGDPLAFLNLQDEIGSTGEELQGQVAGTQIELKENAGMKKEICKTKYAIHPMIFKPVYKDPNTKSKLLGFTQRDIGEQEAVEIWGQSYSNNQIGSDGLGEDGNNYGHWIKDKFSLWEKKECSLDEPDCSLGEYMILREGENQSNQEGFITMEDVNSHCLDVIQGIDIFATENQIIGETEFSLDPEEWLPIYSQPQEETLPIGYTKTKSVLQGKIVYGESYFAENGVGKIEQNENGKWLGYWLQAQFPLWEKLDCEDCDHYLTQLDYNQEQKFSKGYIKLKDAQVKDMPPTNPVGKVLGLTTDEDTSSVVSQAQVNFSEIDIDSFEGDGNLGWVEIASQAGILEKPQKNLIPLGENAQKVAIINSSMASLLGIEEKDTVGEYFDAAFILNSELFTHGEQGESEVSEYKIIGIIPGDKTPAFYLPFSDLKDLGVDNFSQVKVVAVDKSQLQGVRATIESMGFKTSSVADTVYRINSLFSTIRVVLAILGLVALGVAALGMFNTLTVSLLEKTREVGLMKAMGMRSQEVHRLFLTESIIMGFLGGVLGIMLGYLVGKLTSFLISIIAVSKGVGILNLTYIPPYLVLAIIILSSLIGIFTGFFPARRATKISALNALRYE